MNPKPQTSKFNSRNQQIEQQKPAGLTAKYQPKRLKPATLTVKHVNPQTKLAPFTENHHGPWDRNQGA